MIIYLSPQVSDLPRLSLSVSGDIVTICGDDLDLSVMPDNSAIEADAVDNAYIAGSIIKDSSVITLTLLFPISNSAPDNAKFPEPISVTIDGLVTLPPTGD